MPVATYVTFYSYMVFCLYCYLWPDNACGLCIYDLLHVHCVTSLKEMFVHTPTGKLLTAICRFLGHIVKQTSSVAHQKWHYLLELKA